MKWVSVSILSGIVGEVAKQTARHDLSLGEDVTAHLVHRSWPLRTLKTTKARPLAVEENTVVHAFQLMSQNDVRVDNIKLSKEEHQNLRFLAESLDEAPLPFLC
ncbi:hypothetical protein ColLi_09635 [Colletotrichum liriopes]|uniref:Uncharacterized protein n=1 Tax=Colletotrichum liriopes TaxID=708192 RepID=A0AA37GTQ0_9PEZI|nr:hypothetical protein ColLi_09635 [Colletotrichum liriopes]